LHNTASRDFFIRISYVTHPTKSGTRRLSAGNRTIWPLIFRRAADLVSAPEADRNSGLIIAGTHGDENSSIVTFPARCVPWHLNYAVIT
jgi:hypothetical protein